VFLFVFLINKKMCRQTRIIILVFSLIFLINNVNASPLFQRFLFGPLSATTDDPLGHISDFRGRPRTDSRADKPDLFPGFDNADVEAEIKTTTARSRTEIYTEIIGNIIGNVRERITSVITNNLTPIRRTDNNNNNNKNKELENIGKTRRQLANNKNRKLTTVKPQDNITTKASTLITTTAANPIAKEPETILNEKEITTLSSQSKDLVDSEASLSIPSTTSSVLPITSSTTKSTTAKSTTTTSTTTTKSLLNSHSFDSDYSDESKEDNNSEIDVPSVIASAATDGRRRRKDTRINLLKVNPIDRTTTTEFIGLNLNDVDDNSNNDDVSIGDGDSSATVINGNINFLPSLLSAIFNRSIIDEKYNYLQKTPINNNNKPNDNNDNEDAYGEEDEEEQVTIKEDNLIQMMTSMLNPFVEWWSAAMEKINLDKDSQNNNNNHHNSPLKISFNDKFKETINDKIDKNFLLKFFNLNETNINKGKLAFDNAFNKYSTIFYNNKTTINNDDNLININLINELNNIMPSIKDNQQTELINVVVDEDDDLNKTIITFTKTMATTVIPLNINNETIINHNDKTKIFDPEAIGIFILEIFGTVAGLTWGAINHVFHRNTDN